MGVPLGWVFRCSGRVRTRTPEHLNTRTPLPHLAQRNVRVVRDDLIDLEGGETADLLRLVRGPAADAETALAAGAHGLPVDNTLFEQKRLTLVAFGDSRRLVELARQ